MFSRGRILLFVFLTWAFIISCRLFYYTVYSRDYYVEEGNKSAWKCGAVPAARGRILERNGLVLAWTQRTYDLEVDKYPNLCKSNRDIVGELKNKISGLAFDGKRECYVRKNISPDEMEKVSEYLKTPYGVSILPHLERKYVDYPEVRSYLGNVEFTDGAMKGVSGIELKMNTALTGVDGEYIVMVDRMGNWISGTWKLQKDVMAGKDIPLEYSLQEIINMQKKSDEGREL